MKKLATVLVGLVLLGGGCAPTAPTPVSENTEEAVQARMSGQITQIVDDSTFIILKKSPETGEDTTEKISVTYNEKTRFAVPDGSGIGAPIAKPQIEAGMVVEVQGELEVGLDPYAMLFANNIIFNAE
jgi:hypothetical protein